ncbi:hypothetical protein O3P69_002495 [Scylla paramamosain]|uniref:Uncharacterized protein n=1 Tax=Scylla paramamosain TaxID=85552 RepID=A0AAW0UR90_SCYPA
MQYIPQHVSPASMKECGWPLSEGCTFSDVHVLASTAIRSLRGRRVESRNASINRATARRVTFVKMKRRFLLLMLSWWAGVLGQEQHASPSLPSEAFLKPQPYKSIPLKLRPLSEVNPISFEARMKPKHEATSKIVQKEASLMQPATLSESQLKPQAKAEAQEKPPSSLVVSVKPMTEVSPLRKPLEPREAFGEGDRTKNTKAHQPKLSEALVNPDTYSKPDVKPVTLSQASPKFREALFEASRSHLTNEASKRSPTKTQADIQINEALKGLLASYEALTKSILLKSFKTLPIRVLSDAILPSPASLEASKSTSPEASDVEMKPSLMGNAIEKPFIHSKTRLKLDESREAFRKSYTNSEALGKTEISPQSSAKPLHVSEGPTKPTVSSEAAMRSLNYSEAQVEPIEGSEAPTTPNYTGFVKPQTPMEAVIPTPRTEAEALNPTTSQAPMTTRPRKEARNEASHSNKASNGPSSHQKHPEAFIWEREASNHPDVKQTNGKPWYKESVHIPVPVIIVIVVVVIFILLLAIAS